MLWFLEEKEKGDYGMLNTSDISDSYPHVIVVHLLMQQVGGLVPMYVANIPKEISTRNEVAVYVDVSGSMQGYPDYLIRALQAVQRRVKVRTFVFSTMVEE